jgi:uncharacterized membrane protein
MKCRGSSLRLVLAVAVGLIAAALSCVSVLIAHRRIALQTASEADTVWVATDSGFGLAQLEAAISAVQVPGSGVTPEEVAARYGVVRNLLAELGQRDATAALQQIAPLIEHIEYPRAAAEALHVLLPLNPELAHVAAVSNARSRQVTRERLRALVSLQRLFAALVGALLACLMGLSALLARQNHRLTRSHAAVQNLLEDLQRTSAELADANQRVEQSMAKAQLHNQILRARDMELHRLQSRLYVANAMQKNGGYLRAVATAVDACPAISGHVYWP